MIWFVAWHLLVMVGAGCLVNAAVVVLYCAAVEHVRLRRARRLMWSARDDREWREYAAQERKTS